MPDVAMPRLSDSMEEGTILKWLKADGDEVKRGDELVEIETDKANMTYEADEAGVLTIVAKEGDTLPVGEVIARIGEGGGDSGDDSGAAADAEGGAARAPADQARGEETDKAPADEAQADDQDERGSGGDDQPSDEGEDAGPDGDEQPEPKDTAAAPEEQPEPDEQPQADGQGGDDRVKASPIARRMAREMGLDLSAVQGTGPGGRIVKADVEGAGRDGGGGKAGEKSSRKPKADADDEAKQDDKPAHADAPAPKKKDVPAAPAPVFSEAGTAKGTVTVEELSKLQQTVARRMAESKATAPEFVISLEADMDAAVAMRKELKELAKEDGVVPSFNDFVIKACAHALREFPRANGAYRDGRFELYSRVNVGIAVAARDALVVPTIFDADRKSLGQIAADARALAERVRANAITPPELSGGTFTVSNLGMFGIKRFTAVINPPQAAILAVGQMEPRPVVRDGEVVVRNMLDLTLSCDHRILYGADAANFLARIRELLEQPLRLAL